MAILLFVNQCSMIVISLIFVQKSEHAHSTAPPLQTRPTALGSGLGLTVHEMACASFSATKGMRSVLIGSEYPTKDTPHFLLSKLGQRRLRTPLKKCNLTADDGA